MKMATHFPLPQVATASSTAVSTATYSGAPTTSLMNWDQLDNEFRRMLAPVSDGLNSDSITTTEAAEAFTSVLRDHLIHYNLLRDKVKATGPHRERQIVKVTKKLAQAKNALRSSGFHRSPREFLNAVRTHNAAVRTQREFQQRQTTRKQEKAFRNNPWQLLNQPALPCPN